MGLCGSKDDSKDETAGVTTQDNVGTTYQPPKPVDKSPAVETKKQIEEVKEDKATVSPLAASDETPAAEPAVAVPAPAPAPESPKEEVQTPLVLKEEESKAPETVPCAAPVPPLPAENEEDNDNRESIAIEGVPKGHIQCVRCNEVLPKSEFSANQAKKKKTANCKKCVAEKA